MVTDNGTHFTTDPLQGWLHSIGCCRVFTLPRQPAPNRQAEKFVRTLKTAIRAGSPNNVEQLQACINNFLLRYRSACHATTDKPRLDFLRDGTSGRRLDRSDFLSRQRVWTLSWPNPWTIGRSNAQRTRSSLPFLLLRHRNLMKTLKQNFKQNNR